VLLEESIYTTPQADIDDRLRAATIVRVPAATPDGTHYWRVLWGDQAVDLGELVVTAPERTFAVPEMDVHIPAPFYTPDGVLFTTLLGCTFSPELSIFWEVEGETAVSYRVFVHLVDGDGNIVAQSDGEPAHWTRPTTGWLAGEIIVDEHLLDLSSEGNELRIGLYDPETGERLVGETADYAVIPLE
jgi:hypothetical protein